MADIISNMYQSDANTRQEVPNGRPDGAADEDMMAFAELLFFAYREFIGEPDSVLLEYGFGRAHHRVLHFVGRHPGMRVADLLDILNITKQSLARVLKQLVDDGFIRQVEGRNDRRERRLYLTSDGNDLVNKLFDFQRQRISNALAASGPESIANVKAFLLNMVSEEDRQRVIELIEAQELPENWRDRSNAASPDEVRYPLKQ